MNRFLIGLKKRRNEGNSLYSVTCKFRNPRQTNLRKREKGRESKLSHKTGNLNLDKVILFSQSLSFLLSPFYPPSAPISIYCSFHVCLCFPLSAGTIFFFFCFLLKTDFLHARKIPTGSSISTFS